MKVSTTGYKRNSKDKKHKQLYIPGDILTMLGVDDYVQATPVYPDGAYGGSIVMKPGVPTYNFPGAAGVIEQKLDKFALGGPGDPIRKVSMPATAADSALVVNRANDVLDFYGTNPVYGIPNYKVITGSADDPFAKLTPAEIAKRLNRSKEKYIARTKEADPYMAAVGQVDRNGKITVTTKPKLEDYYQDLGNNKFLQREITSGAFNVDSPMPLYDKRIDPQNLSYFELKPEFEKDFSFPDEYGNVRIQTMGDYVEVPTYDVLATTPWNQLSKTDKVKRLKDFGESGSPYKSAKEGIDQLTKKNPNEQRVIFNTDKGDIVKVQDIKTKKIIRYETVDGEPIDMENPTQSPANDFYDRGSDAQPGLMPGKEMRRTPTFSFQSGGQLPKAQYGPPDWRDMLDYRNAAPPAKQNLVGDVRKATRPTAVAESTNVPTQKLPDNYRELQQQKIAQDAYDALPEAMKRRDTLTADTRSDAEKFARRALTAVTSPMETIAAVNKGYDIPSGYMGMHNAYEGYGVGSPMTSVVDMAAGLPAFIGNAAYRQGEQIVDDPLNYAYTMSPLGLLDSETRGQALGNYLDLAMVIPTARMAAGPLVKNAYKINPWAGKLGEYNRVVGSDAIADLQASGLVRSGEGAMTTMDGIPISRPTAWPSFAKGAPGETYIKGVTQRGDTPYIISTDRPMGVSTLGRHGKGSTQFPIGEDGKYLTSFPASEATVYEAGSPHWLRGYKAVDTPAELPGSPNAISDVATTTATTGKQSVDLSTLPSTFTTGDVNPENLEFRSIRLTDRGPLSKPFFAPFVKDTGMPYHTEYVKDLNNYFSSPQFNKIMDTQYPNVDKELYKKAVFKNLDDPLAYDPNMVNETATGTYYSKGYVDNPDFSQRVKNANKSNTVGSTGGKSYVSSERSVKHEYDHQRTNSSELLPDFLTNDYLMTNMSDEGIARGRREIAEGTRYRGDNYYSKPTEFDVRIRRVKEDLKENGIVDYFNEPITEEHINQLLAKQAQNETNSADLLQRLWREFQTDKKAIRENAVLSDVEKKKEIDRLTNNYVEHDTQLSSKKPKNAVHWNTEQLLRYWDPNFIAKTANLLPAAIPVGIGIGVATQQKKKGGPVNKRNHKDLDNYFAQAWSKSRKTA